jgi:hypothetical protein
MANEESPFVVSELRPQRRDQHGRGVYQLTATSASPKRFTGRDEHGMPIEDTLPTVYWKYFVMPSGNVNKVPLRTGSVFSKHVDAVAYETETITELIESGCIPLWLCPYSTDYTHITHGPFAKPPAGEEACGGAEDGCSHLKKIMKVRQERVLTKHNAEVKRIEAMKDDQIERMAKGMVEGVGQAMAKHLTAQDALNAGKNRLRKGDE